MNDERYQLILKIRFELNRMRPDERIRFFEALTVGYCQSCGNRLGVNGTCNCQNDE